MTTDRTIARTTIAAAMVHAIDALGARAPADLLAWRAAYADAFADTRKLGRKLGRKRKEVAAVNAYQAALTKDYEEWATDLAEAVAEDPDNTDEIIAAALLALLLLLQRRGAEHLPDAVTLALASPGGMGTPAIWQRLVDAIASNNTFLAESLLPAIGERLREMLASGEWALALDVGGGPLVDFVMGWLTTFAARVASYAGTWWTLNQTAFGIASAGKPIVAYLDPQARHCSECPLYHSEAGEVYDSYESYLGATGGRVPGEFECKNGCRCWLELDDGAIVQEGDLP